MRYHLRTLLIVLALGPPVLAFQYRRWQDSQLWSTFDAAKQRRDVALAEWQIRSPGDAIIGANAPAKYLAASRETEAAAKAIGNRYKSKREFCEPERRVAESRDPPMFRFTIRELVLVTLVVAMGVGWWANRRSIVAVANDRFTQEMHLLKKYFQLTFDRRRVLCH